MIWFDCADPFTGSFSASQANLEITGTEPAQLLLARLLTGTCKFKYSHETNYIYSRINFTQLPYNSRSRSFNRIFTAFLPSGYSLDDYSSYIGQNRIRNKEFYEEICQEIANCLYWYEKKRFANSFIFLYRFLETISFAFPQIYALREREFNKTYDHLKGFFNNDKTATELKFFKMFCTKILTSSYSTSTIKVDTTFASSHAEQDKIWDELHRLANSSNTFRGGNKPTHLEIDLVNFGSFIIEVRNRYFHFLRGTWQENVSSKNIANLENMFQSIISPSLNWIGILYMELTSAIIT